MQDGGSAQPASRPIPGPETWESRERAGRWAHLAWWGGQSAYLLTVTDEAAHVLLSAQLDRLDLHQLVSWGAAELRRRPAARRI